MVGENGNLRVIIAHDGITDGMVSSAMDMMGPKAKQVTLELLNRKNGAGYDLRPHELRPDLDSGKLMLVVSRDMWQNFPDKEKYSWPGVYSLESRTSYEYLATQIIGHMIQIKL